MLSDTENPVASREIVQRLATHLPYNRHPGEVNAEHLRTMSYSSRLIFQWPAASFFSPLVVCCTGKIRQTALQPREINRLSTYSGVRLCYGATPARLSRSIYCVGRAARSVGLRVSSYSSRKTPLGNDEVRSVGRKWSSLEGKTGQGSAIGNGRDATVVGCRIFCGSSVLFNRPAPELKPGNANSIFVFALP